MSRHGPPRAGRRLQRAALVMKRLLRAVLGSRRVRSASRAAQGRPRGRNRTGAAVPAGRDRCWLMSLKAVIVPPAEAGSSAGWSRQLMPIANRPLLGYALDDLREAGVGEVAVVVEAASAWRIRRAVEENDASGLRVHYLQQPEPLDLCGAMRLADRFLDGSAFVLHFGDSLASEPLQRFAREQRRKELDALVLLRGGGQSEGGAIVGLAQRRLLSADSHSASLASGATPAGVYLFGPRLVEVLRELDVPAPGELGIGQALQQLRERGGRLATELVNGWWRYDASPAALLDANRLVLERLVPQVAGALQNSRIEGRVAVDRSALLESATVRGPAIIGPDARITDTYIGPYTSIGAGVVVEGAEIENSIVFPGATISFLGQRLDASVVGSGAKIVRDFRLPTGVRVCVGDGAEVSLT
jgi:glucose-1-phosphate thymidylyltransferase